MDIWNGNAFVQTLSASSDAARFTQSTAGITNVLLVDTPNTAASASFKYVCINMCGAHLSRVSLLILIPSLFSQPSDCTGPNETVVYCARRRPSNYCSKWFRSQRGEQHKRASDGTHSRPLVRQKALHHAICVPLLLVLQVVGTGTFISNDPANNILTVESTASPYTGNVISMWKTGAGVSGNMMLFTQGSTPLVNVRRLVLSFKHRVLIPILPPSLA